MPRTKRTRKQWSGLVRAWRKSSLTAAEFGAREGIDPGQLRWWAWRIAKDESSRPASIDFVELPESASRDDASSYVFELTWPDGRVLRFSANVQRAALRTIIEAVEGRR